MGVAKITVYRATSILTDLGIIEFKHGSYVRIDDGKEYFDSDTKKNIALVAGVKGLMQQYKDTPVFNNLVELLYKLEPNLAKDDEIFSSARITVPPQIEYNVNPHNWNKVYEALKRNVKIKFRYKKPYTNQLAQRTVCPYQLLLDDGSVYLFAHSDYAEMELLYDLNFMADIIVTNEEFALPKDFDFKFRCGGGRLGAYKGLNVEKYVIRFTGYAKEWIKHHKWADDQEITEALFSARKRMMIDFDCSSRVIQVVLTQAFAVRNITGYFKVRLMKCFFIKLFGIREEFRHQIRMSITDKMHFFIRKIIFDPCI